MWFSTFEAQTVLHKLLPVLASPGRQITRVRPIRPWTLYEKRVKLLHPMVKSKMAVKKKRKINSYFYTSNSILRAPKHLSRPLATIKSDNQRHLRRKRHPKTPAQQPSSTAAAIISPNGFEKKKAQHRSAFQISPQKESLPFWRVGLKLTAQKYGLENIWHTNIVSRRYPQKKEGNKTYLAQGPVSNVVQYHQAYRRLA